MAPTPVLLPGKSHGRRSLVGCSPWGREESETTEGLHFHFSLPCIGKGNGNPLQCSCLENPRDGGAWWAALEEVGQVAQGVDVALAEDVPGVAVLDHGREDFGQARLAGGAAGLASGARAMCGGLALLMCATRFGCMEGRRVKIGEVEGKVQIGVHSQRAVDTACCQAAANSAGKRASTTRRAAPSRSRRGW